MISTLCQFPQTFSRDMYVRLRAADIAALELIHLHSEVTGRAYSTQPAGVTEWIGKHGQNMLSIAWDWIILSDGLFCMPSDAVIRTNIMLVDGRGYDTDPAATDKACALKVASLGWQDNLQLWLRRSGLA